MAQPDRQKLLDETAEKGFLHISNTRRRGLQGREFDIVEGELFNVEGPDGRTNAPMHLHYCIEELQLVYNTPSFPPVCSAF